MKKIGFAIIGFLSLGMGMGLNIQYALDDYEWAENSVVKLWASIGSIDISWPDPNKPIEPGKVAQTKPCTLSTPNGVTGSVMRVCSEQYVCPTCSCTPVACGGVFFN